MSSQVITNPTPATRPSFQNMLFLLPFSLPFIGYYFGEQFDFHIFGAWFTPLFLLGITPILDLLIGESTTNPPEYFDNSFRNTIALRILPMLALPAWLPLLFWSIHHTTSLSTLVWAGWVLSLTFVAGACLINASHELMHRNTKFERMTGGLLLACVWNLTFKIEHIRGHHLDVATTKDHSSATTGQTIYSFIRKALVGNIMRAWFLETNRLKAQSKPWYQNEMLHYGCFSLGLTLLVSNLFGLPGVIFYLALSFSTNVLLEIINYIEHYSLLRESKDDKLEPVGVDHSWNSNYWFSNALLLNLQRHSDHHMNAGRPYHALRHMEHGPQLPFGYATMISIALIPPLWRVIMDPLAQRQALKRTTPIPLQKSHSTKK